VERWSQTYNKEVNKDYRLQ